MADLKFISSTFGGGWLIPISDEAFQAYTEQFDEKPHMIEPLGGQIGWIIEPQELADVLADIRADGFDLLTEA